MTDQSGLEVIIVGSGLAGLTAARILREHHRVTVYERGDATHATGGQGIVLAPNGVKVLNSIGYDARRAGAVPILGIRTYNKECEVGEDAELDLMARFGAECLAQKRSDFRDELLRLATAPSVELGIGGSPAEVVLNTPVVGLDADEGTVTLSDGSKKTGDVVVVADGIHSRLRSTIGGSNDYPLRKAGLTCYRTAISTEQAKKALGDLPLPHWWEPETCQNRSSIIYSADGTSRLVTAYPIRNQTSFNLSCVVKTQESSDTTADMWHEDGDRGAMMSQFDDFHEPLRRILSSATEVKVWELQDLTPLPTWTRGRAILIGDAAHAMTPMQGQGANMSIEDAESLRLLKPGTRRGEVAALLQTAESVRRPRVLRVLEETRRSHGNVGVTERATRNMEFHCSYDGIEAALRAQQAQQQQQ